MAVTILSVVGTVLLSERNNLWYNLFLALFGSAFLGLIMSVTEYYVERKRALESFWKTSLRVTNELRKAKPMNCEIPKDLCIQCIAEKINNQEYDRYGGEMATLLGLSREETKAKAYANWIADNECPTFSEGDDIDNILLRVAHDRIDHEYERFISRIDNLIMISKIDLSDVSQAYENLDFLANGNRKIKLFAYNKIYNKLSEVLNRVRSEVYHFNLWKEGKGNFVVCISKVYELQELLFNEETRTDEGVEFRLVFAKVVDEIMESLEEFRVFIYGTKARVEYKPTAIVGQLVSFTNSDEEINH